METKKISQEDLRENLEILKTVLEKVETTNKIVFINLKSFYSYLKFNYFIDVEKIMEKIEPFIPLTLCISLDNNLFYLLNFALEADLTDRELDYLKNSFYDKARMTFFNLIIKTKANDEWEKLLSACEELREMAE